MEWFQKIQIVSLYVGSSGLVIHCPFCGRPSGAAFESCEHLLYIIVEGMFMEASSRFLEAADLTNYADDILGIPCSPSGTAEKFTSSISLQGHIQFALQTVNDVILVGFSDLLDVE